MTTSSKTIAKLCWIAIADVEGSRSLVAGEIRGLPLYSEKEEHSFQRDKGYALVAEMLRNVAVEAGTGILIEDDEVVARVVSYRIMKDRPTKYYIIYQIHGEWKMMNKP